MEAECNNVEIETPEDELSKLTHKLEHEMDELAKLEEEVVKEQERQELDYVEDAVTVNTDASEVKIEMNEETLIVSKPKNQQKKLKRQQIGCGDKLILLDSGKETWL